MQFNRCAAEKGEDAKECQKYAKYYRSLCPAEWVNNQCFHLSSKLLWGSRQNQWKQLHD
jgi:hypothetical protein